jgi:hypothetical protein
VEHNTIDFITHNLLPLTWDRETHKQVTERIEDALFDKQYTNMLQANNTEINPQV